MKLIQSKQRNIAFAWCPHPVTIDKSEDWGPGNIQEFPDGVFLKYDGNGVISHGVQPNEDKTAPVGWYQMGGVGPSGLYMKLPIWADAGNTLYPSDTKDWINRIPISTLDGEIMYDITEPSVIVAQDDNGMPSEKDKWVITLAELKKNYIL